MKLLLGALCLLPSIFSTGQAHAQKRVALVIGNSVQPIANEDDNPFELLMQHLDGTSRGLPSEKQ